MEKSILVTDFQSHAKNSFFTRFTRSFRFWNQWISLYAPDKSIFIILARHLLIKLRVQSHLISDVIFRGGGVHIFWSQLSQLKSSTCYQILSQKLTSILKAHATSSFLHPSLFPRSWTLFSTYPRHLGNRGIFAALSLCIYWSRQRIKKWRPPSERAENFLSIGCFKYEIAPKIKEMRSIYRFQLFSHRNHCS